ncbi:MAG: Tail Collar domain protein [Myxococcaceae bacterium]|jgi:microcystin-dependent protein|nr:Tail Collar domain protein [Myxococcaceae bacterium]
MKIKVVIVDLEISRRTKRLALLAGIPLAVLLGSGALVYANVKHTFTSGETLSSVAMNENFADLDGRVAALETQAVRGAIVAFAGPVAAIPPGWALCDGSAVSRTGATAGLFVTIGTLHGSGDGSTTFNLPDLRGRFTRGIDTTGRDPGPRVAANPGGSTGNTVGSLENQGTAMPTTPFTTVTAGDHTHGITGHTLYGAGVFTGTNFGGSGTNFNPLVIQNAGNHTHGIVGGDNETRPANVGVLFIIKL